MAAERGNAYSAPDPCSESLEKMTKRLTSDLRARVRRLLSYPPLSPEWISTTDTLQHLASVAMMEEKDSASKKEAGSIWERDELCVRYIIEEGKINLLLRMMNDFKKFQYQGASEGFKDDSKISMRVFEQSLGILLKCCFTAVEALQTLDLTSVVEHVAMVLKYALDNPDQLPSDCTCQEFLAVSYLDLMFRKIDALNSQDTVMKQVESNELVSIVLTHYEKFADSLEKDMQEHYAYFLANMMETEMFQTHRAKYLPDAATKKRLVLLEGITKELLSTDQENRKALRALSDAIIRSK